MNGPRTTDLLYLLSLRADLLNALHEGIDDKRKLEEAVGTSRSNLNRALKDLENDRLIEERRDGFEVTIGGKTALELYERTWVPLARSLPLLEMISSEAPFSPELVTGATVVQADLSNPDRPIDRLAELLADCGDVRATLPVWTGRYTRLFFDRVDTNNERIELVLDRDCLDLLYTKHAEQFQTALSNGEPAIYRTETKGPFSLVVVDSDRMWLGIHDAEGCLKGAIVNDTDAAVETATEIVAWRRECGERIEPFDDGSTAHSSALGD